VFDPLPNRAIPVSCDQTVAANHAIIRHEVRNSAVRQAGSGEVLINRQPWLAAKRCAASGSRSGDSICFPRAPQAAQP
jgi:hypothetical protein